MTLLDFLSLPPVAIAHLVVGIVGGAVIVGKLLSMKDKEHG